MGRNASGKINGSSAHTGSNQRKRTRPASAQAPLASADDVIGFIMANRGRSFTGAGPTNGATPHVADASARKRPPATSLRFIDLFCGIGGFRIAFERAGATCVFSSDWDKFARQTYAAHFGEEPHGDINQIPVENIPTATH